MSAMLDPHPAYTVLSLAACVTTAEIAVHPDTGYPLAVEVRLTEDGPCSDSTLLVADDPAQLERLAAEAMVAAQKLRDARNARKPAVPS